MGATWRHILSQTLGCIRTPYRPSSILTELDRAISNKSSGRTDFSPQLGFVRLLLRLGLPKPLVRSPDAFSRAFAWHPRKSTQLHASYPRNLISTGALVVDLKPLAR